MMEFKIDGQVIEAEAGMTVLQAARRAGIKIPSLCYHEGLPHQTSCFICAIRVKGSESLQPACALPVAQGLEVEFHSAEVETARKTALELLFSDHAGRCEAPCAVACPASLDIPAFLKAVEKGDTPGALEILSRRLPLAGVLGKVCAGYCQKACVRRKHDEPLSVQCLHGRVAQENMSSGAPWLPEKKAASGKTVAILGSGPVALSAAWFLLQEGHACRLIEEAPRAGGALRQLTLEGQLEEKLLDGEIALIERLGAEIVCGKQAREGRSLDEMLSMFDAVLVADPVMDGKEKGKGSSPALDSKPENLFHAVSVVSDEKSVVRAVNAGRTLAVSIGQYLAGESVTGPEKPLYFAAREPSEEEDRALFVLSGAPEAPAPANADPKREAARCLQCSCVKRDTCRLRHYGARYGVQPQRFKGERRRMEPDQSHGEVVYDPGKCILCGLCLRVAEAAGEARGLSFVGRGFPTRVAVPLGGQLLDGLAQCARECAAICPTAALSLKPGRD
jgi:ferredoxin